MATKKKESVLKVNFGDTDKEIRKHTKKASRVPEGDYLVKILRGEVKQPQDEDKAKYINWAAQIVKPAKHKGKVLYGMTSLKKGALWNLRNLIHAATGKNVAGKAVNLDLEVTYGKIVGAAVEDDEYEGKIRSRINTWFPKDEYEESESDDDEEDSDDDEEDDDEEEDDTEEEDEDLEDVDVEDL